MNNDSYELSIVSRDQRSDGKKLKQYDMVGAKIVGVYDGENFELQIKNNTYREPVDRFFIDTAIVSKRIKRIYQD